MKNSIRPSSEDAIIEAAFTLLNKDPSASLSQIASLAGVGRATLHRYFSSREDLIKTLAQTAIREMNDVVENAIQDIDSYTEVAKIILEVLIPLGDRHGFLALEAFEHDEELKTEFKRQKQETADLMEGLKEEGLLDISTPTSWIIQVYDHILFAAWESVKNGETTVSQASDLAWRTFINGLGKPSQ